MKRSRALRSLVAVLVPIAVVMPLSLAFADAPGATTQRIDDTLTPPALCGFAVAQHREGWVTTTIHQDPAGAQVVDISTHLRETYTSATASVSGMAAFTTHLTSTTVAPGTRTLTITRTGIVEKVTIPGVGEVSNDTGRLVEVATIANGWAGPPQVTFQSGRQNPAFVSTLCAALR